MIRNPPATTWGAGDYPWMASRLNDAAARAVRAVGAGPRDDVLDVACGTGNAALLAAARGARTTAIDFEPDLVDIARGRAATEGAEVDWRVGDATAMPFDDEQFSVVVSVFGVMYAADHHAAAAELARVCADGGRVALTAWTPESFMPALGAALAPYLPPPPPGGQPPSRWGDAAAIRELLAGHGLVIQTSVVEHLWLAFGGRNEAVDFLVATAGNVMAERGRLVTEDRWDAMRADVEALVGQRNEGDEIEVDLPLSYRLVTAVRARR